MKAGSKLKLVIVLIVAAVLVVIALGVAAIADRRSTTDQQSDEEIVTVEGEYVCLPKEGPGPHTMECALGIHADDDEYFQLNTLRLYDDTESPGFDYQIGDRLRVSGEFDPAGANDIYISEGIIDVESVELLE